MITLSPETKTVSPEAAAISPGAADPCWHCETVEGVLGHLGVSREGLGAEEAARRLEEHGPNEFAAGRRVSVFLLLLSHFSSATMWRPRPSS